jgi:CheY-like chemotaxis protein
VGKPLLIILTTSEVNASRLKNDLKRDFDLVLTKSGHEALAAIQKKMPTAIIMDHSIEDFMTYRFIDKVRNNPVTRNLSFILVSRESSHTFVHEAVRSGVSHYIGIPYEKEIFLEKIKIALRPGEIPLQQPYFTLPTSLETQVISYGRISYVSAQGIHFETRLSLNAGDRVVFTSPLAEAIEELSLDATVTQRGLDVFYNYPFAIDANWTDPQVAKKVKTWISRNQNLNSPKKSKILFISDDTKMEREIDDILNKSHYSASVSARDRPSRR